MLSLSNVMLSLSNVMLSLSNVMLSLSNVMLSVSKHSGQGPFRTHFNGLSVTATYDLFRRPHINIPLWRLLFHLFRLSIAFLLMPLIFAQYVKVLCVF